MIKNLYLVRHAQAESQGAGVKDFDRALLHSGMSEASRLGKKILDKGIKIDKVISSAATRAELTAELICNQVNFPYNKVVFDPEVYESTVRTLLNIVNKVEEGVKELLLVGHNPVISYFAEHLTSESIGSLPPAGMVVVEFEINSWGAVSAASGKLKYIDIPNV